MFIFKPLTRRPIALLWSGQVLSSVGDEIHRVALIWLAAGLLGFNTGYLAALQAASVFALSLLASLWADQWDHRKTMIWVDIVRGLVVLALPISSFFGPPNLWVLVPVAIIVSGLNALFNPALQAVVPYLADDRDLLSATNGLMETTVRFARIIGPGLVALFSSVIPLIQFFSLDALSFFVSAGTVAAVGEIKMAEPPSTPTSLRENFFGGFKAIKKDALTQYLVLTNGIVNPAWYLVFPLALGLLLHEKMPQNVGAMGLVIFAYGIGNLASNLAVGSFKMTRPVLFSMLGRFMMGIGFVGIAAAPNLGLMMLAASIAATGGPMTDLSFLAVIQKQFRSQEIAKIFRLNMAVTYGPLLVILLASPTLFRVLSLRWVIGLCGISMILVALGGAALFPLTRRH